MASTTLVCAALVGKTVDEMLEKVGQAKTGGADLVEFRVDYITDFNAERDLPTLLNARILPAIVTYRPKWEGGMYEGPEAPRLAALKLAADLGADYVDVELKAATESFPSRKEKGGTKFIVSSHNYECTPSVDVMGALAAKCVSAGADIVKLVTTAHDITDNVRMLQLMTRSTVPIITLVMGQKGEISRILAAKFGGFLTFGTLAKGQESAPGQPTLEQLIKVYRVKEMGRDTKVYGLAGNPVSHSKSPLFHNLVYSEQGMNCVYLPFMVEDLSSFLKAFDGEDFAGFSVTLPHKETAAKIADDLESLAKQIGAVNTLVRKKDMKLCGYNTDCVGALTGIEDGLRAAGLHTNPEQPLQGKTFVVIGAGGAGKALAFGAYARGAKVIVANRTIAKGQALANQLGPNAEAITLDQLDEMKATKGFILANTSSVGMLPNPDASPIARQALKGYELVFDAIYTPKVTKLLREAGEWGVTTVSGIEMFIGQAILQFELLTGTIAPVQFMRELIQTF
ncbi:unnamed protein product [Calypogeia fissa]